MGSKGNSAESGEKEKKKKKLLIPIIIIISVLLLGGTAGVLAATGVFKGSEPTTEAPTETETETEAPTETESDEPDYSDVQIWWNVDRSKYAGQSDIGTSSRPTNKDDGYYHVLFATEGRQVTRRVAEKKILNIVDGNDIMGLRFDEKGIINEVLRIDEFTGGYEIQGWYVTAIDADTNTVTVNSAANLGGMDEDYEIPTSAIIYDVSGQVNYVGMPIAFTDLKEKDRIFAIRNLEGEVYRIFVTDRYVKPQIYWNVERQYNSELLQTKREPNAEGVYEILMACNGEQVIVKTKDRKVATNIDKVAAKCVGLTFDSDGYCIKAIGASTAMGGSFGSWYHIQTMEGNHIVAKKTSATASDYGKVQEGDLADDYRAFDVSGKTADFVGQEIFDLRPTDQIHGLKDQAGKIAIVFVVSRKVDSKIYWNMSRKYNSTTKQTTREKEADGYYHYKLAVDGTVKEFVTNSKAIASEVDSYAARCFGLKLSGNKILGTYSAAQVIGSSFGSWHDITYVSGNTVRTLKDPKSTASDAGKRLEGTLAPNCKVVNVSGYYVKQAGEYTKVQVGDQIHGLTGTSGYVEVIFVIKRKAPTANLYCPVCDKTVLHNAVTDISKAQTDASGKYLAVSHYYVPQNMSMSGQGSTTYVSSKSADGKSTIYTKTSDVHLNLNGKTLTAAEDARLFAQFGKDADGNGGNMIVFDTSEGKTGTLKSTAGRDGDKGAFFWTQYDKSTLVMKDITIDLSALNATGGTGAFCATNSNVTYEFDNCKIIGSNNVSNIGAVFYMAGKLTLNDTEIIGGKAETGGPIYLTETAKLYINGNTKISGGSLKDGTTVNIYAKKGALIYTNDGITSADGSIGITTEVEGVFTSTGFAGLDKKFVSDIPGGTITEDGGKLSIKYVIDGVKFTADTLSVEVGEAKQFAAQTTPAPSNTVKITYESSDPESVMVNPDGTIVGVKETATPVTVTATAVVGEDTFTATVEVSVKPATKALTHYHAEATNAEIANDEGAKINYTAWTDATKIPTTSGYYYLDTDIQLTSQQSMAENVVLHICLNGHKIIGNLAETATRAISLHNAGTELTICDCSEGESGQIVACQSQGGMTNQGRAVWLRYGNFNMYGGTIIGGPTNYTSSSGSYGGGAVYVAANTTFNMYGGTIKDGIAVDTATDSSVNGGGGNVSVAGTFNMYGGVIENGLAGHGGNIYARSATAVVNIYGGIIRGGYAGYEKNASGELVKRTIVDPETNKSTNWRCGGNIYLYNKAHVNIYGGLIEDGHALGGGGNIFVGSTDGLTVNGTGEEKPLIQNGVAGSYGGNIASDTNYAYSLENAEFVGGEAGGHGASIYLQGPGLTMKNVTVTGGKTNSSGQVYIGNGTVSFENVTIGSAELTNDTIDANRASLVFGNVKGLPTATIKDSAIDAIYLASIDTLTLDGTVTCGTAEKAGLVLGYAGYGDKVVLADTFSTDSQITLYSVPGSMTVVSNGASKIDCFTQINGEEFALAADGEKLVLQGADYGKHKHCDCGTGDLTVGSHTCDAQVWTEWTATDSLPTSTGYYYLASDVTIASTVRFGLQQDIHLCLNGHKVTTTCTRTLTSYTGKSYDSAKPSTTGHVGGTSYTITDCAETAGSIVTTKTGNENNGGLIWIANNKDYAGNTINIYRVTLAAENGAYTTKAGGLLYGSNETVYNMYSGTVMGGKVAATGAKALGDSANVSATGANVHIQGNATFNMYGGEIKDGSCSAEYFAAGANVYVSGTSTFNMHGGKISGGTVTKAVSSAILDAPNVGVTATFTMDGGEIDGSSLDRTDSAVWGDTNSHLTISGGKVIGYVNSKSTQEDALTLNGTPEIDKIYLQKDIKLTIGETFATRAGAPIAIQMNKPGTFTTNEGNVDDFKSFDETYHIEKNTDGTLTLTEGQIPEVELDVKEATLYIGSETVVLTATPNELATEFTLATWTSSDDTVATVTQDETDPLKATVTRLKEGEVTITVTLQVESDAPKAECKITCLGDEFHKHCVCGGCFESGAQLTDSLTHTCEEVEWTPWESASKLPSYDDLEVGANYFYLTKDVQLTAIWYANQKEDSTKATDMSDRSIVICLNGHTVQNKSGNRFASALVGTSPSITYTEGLSVTFTDCAETAGTIKLTGNFGKNQGGFFLSAGLNTELNIYNITIDGSESTGNTELKSSGGLISFTGEGDVVNIYSGTITGGKITGTPTDKQSSNSTNWGGGNIYLSKGTLNMYGGTVQNGQSTLVGGNIFINTAATFNMYGGEVKDGKVDSGFHAQAAGGNIYSRGTFNMYGGTISGGEARENKSASANTVVSNFASQGKGGSIFISHGTFNMTGGTITGGWGTFGGNICVYAYDSANPTTVNITGGTITAGKAFYGAGLRITQSSSSCVVNVNIGGTAQITGNILSSSTAYAGGIHMDKGNLTITGNAKISGNEKKSADFAGDDIYLKKDGTFNVEFKEYTGTDPIYIGIADGNKTAVAGKVATVDADYSAVLMPMVSSYELVKDGTDLNYAAK